MRRGKLDHLLRFQSKGAIATDGQQRQPAAFADVADAGAVPAMFIPKAGQESFENGQQVSTAPALFIFDYMPALDALDTQWRVHDGAQYWEITAVVWNGRTNSSMEISVIRFAHK